MKRSLPRPPSGTSKVILLVLVCAAQVACRDDLGLAEVIYQCDAERPCAAGWLCAAGHCLEAGTVSVSVYGAPAAEYPGLYPFGGCDHLRLCYSSGDESALQGCEDFPWSLDTTDRTVGFSVPVGAEIHVAAQCLGGAAVVSTGRSCPGSFGLQGGELRLYLMPPNSIGPTVNSSGEATGLHTPRLGATVTPLPDGRVLIAGGTAAQGAPPLDSAEFFDPRTGVFTEVAGPAGRMLVPRVHARAALLPDGRVAIFGGLAEDGEATAAVELFDPEDSEFATAPPTALPRVFHTATPLADSGDVLVVGGLGDSGASYEVWNADVGSDNTEPLLESRSHHTATAATSGTGPTGSSVVLIVGGAGDGYGSPVVRNTMEVYVVGEDHSSETLPLCVQDDVMGSNASAMTGHEAVLVANGGLCLALGGVSDSSSVLASSDVCIWDANLQAWAGDSGVYRMTKPRARFAAAVARGVESSSVFVAGGLGSAGDISSTSSTERLPLPPDADGPALLAPQPVPTPLLVPRWDHDAVTLCDGRVLIVGGLTGPSVDEATVTAITEVYNP